MISPQWPMKKKDGVSAFLAADEYWRWDFRDYFNKYGCGLSNINGQFSMKIGNGFWKDLLLIIAHC
jgi:hypothetical protein